jgi:hypothetical protein
MSSPHNSAVSNYERLQFVKVNMNTYYVSRLASKCTCLLAKRLEITPFETKLRPRLVSVCVITSRVFFDNVKIQVVRSVVADIGLKRPAWSHTSTISESIL